MENELQKLDSLINSYLFDIEYYSSIEEPNAPSILLEEEKKIKKEMENLSLELLNKLYEKYYNENKELIDEIEWRKANGKARDINKELIQQAIESLLKEMDKIIEIKKEKIVKLMKKKMPQFYQEKSSEIKKRLEGKRVIEENIKNILQQSSEIENKEKKEKETIEKDNILKKDNISDNKEIDSSSKIHEKSKKLQEEEIKEKITNEELTPEERIKRIINEYWDKRPKIDWKERDKLEEQKRLERFKKELEKKRKLEEYKKKKEEKKKIKNKKGFIDNISKIFKKGKKDKR